MRSVGSLRNNYKTNTTHKADRPPVDERSTRRAPLSPHHACELNRSFFLRPCTRSKVAQPGLIGIFAPAEPPAKPCTPLGTTPVAVPASASPAREDGKRAVLARLAEATYGLTSATILLFMHNAAYRIGCSREG